MSESVIIRPLETQYNGYRFRSRLEARWAVFMDCLDIKYSYEPEGFDLGEGGWYLPDFYLFQQEMFLEIKPYRHYDDWPEMKKQMLLNMGTGKMVVMLCGEPGPVEPYSLGNSYNGWIPGDPSYYWCQCPACGSLGIQFDGRSARNNHKKDCTALTGDKGYNLNSLPLLQAYKEARSSRF